jgi:hypothetical protein
MQNPAVRFGAGTDRSSGYPEHDAIPRTQDLPTTTRPSASRSSASYTTRGKSIGAPGEIVEPHELVGEAQHLVHVPGRHRTATSQGRLEVFTLVAA